MPADPPFDLAQVDRLLTTTKAVRRRLDLTRPVDDPDATVLRIGGLITLAAVEVTSRPVLRPV